MKKQKKIVLAYSGGLDTSIILKWLQKNYDAEVIAYTADVGQEMDRKKIIKNAKKLGVKKIIIQDLKNIFVKDYVYPMIRGHALYEGVYLLGTSSKFFPVKLFSPFLIYSLPGPPTFDAKITSFLLFVFSNQFPIITSVCPNVSAFGGTE